MKDKNQRMEEIWLDIKNGEKRFVLDFDPKTKHRRLTVKGDVYYFENIYSYRSYGKETRHIIKIKLTNAWKVEP